MNLLPYFTTIRLLSVSDHAMPSSKAVDKIIVLITGANQGIGFEVVKKLARDADYHILLGSRSFAKGHEASQSISEPSSVEPIELDVTSDDSILAAVDAVISKFGRLDILVNNAGIGPSSLPRDTPQRQKFEATLSTNVISASSVTDAFLPLLRLSKNPRIVFVSSAVGSIAETLDPKASHYGYGATAMPYKASKAAMNLVTAQYAVMLKGEHFSVNACTPGLCATNFSNGRGQDPSIGAEIIVRLAKGEVEGTGGFWDNNGRLPW